MNFSRTQWTAKGGTTPIRKGLRRPREAEQVQLLTDGGWGFRLNAGAEEIAQQGFCRLKELTVVGYYFPGWCQTRAGYVPMPGVMTVITN